MGANPIIIQAAVRVISDRMRANSYGVQLRSLPEISYSTFAEALAPLCQVKGISLFLIGLTLAEEEVISSTLPQIDGMTCSFSVEDAEDSRNSGDESVFRIIIVRRHVAKVSSLGSFEEVTSRDIYKSACDVALERLGPVNDRINHYVKTLRREAIRQVVSLDGLLNYFDSLLACSPEELSTAIIDNLYLLSLYRDSKLTSLLSPDTIVKRITANRTVVQKVAALEKADRNSVRSYAAEHPTDSTAFTILRFYEKRDPCDLRGLEYTEVESCLKTATGVSRRRGHNPSGSNTVKPGALGITMAFDGNEAAIDEMLNRVRDELDTFLEDHSGIDRPQDISIRTEDGPLVIRYDPIVDEMTSSFSGESNCGGIVYADCSSPREVLRELDRFPTKAFDSAYVNELVTTLMRFSDIELVPKLQRMLELRKRLVDKLPRLQDSPMLQVLSRSCYEDAKHYVDAYASLLSSINTGDYGKMFAQDSSAAREIIAKLMSLDIVFVLGEKGRYVIPTPLSPIYLWKFVALATEIYDGRETLDEDDKQFVIRKSEEMPDPLSVMLIPYAISTDISEFLPFSGRIGCVPYYSSIQQIDRQDTGMEVLEQRILGYVSLYPHAQLMLRLAVVNPPSVDSIVELLKSINASRGLHLDGIALSIFRTTNTDSSWAEIDDKSISEGILGRIVSEGSEHFNIVIKDKRISYETLLSELRIKQHILVIFDPNDKEVSIVGDNKYLQIHPLCIPKIFRYKSISESVEVGPSSQGSMFSDYADIVERLNDRPAPIAHTGMSYRAKIERETYKELLKKADWLIILDQSLKVWDISLITKEQKLFFKQAGYRGIGIYSADSKKLQIGFRRLIAKMGNLVSTDAGIQKIMGRIRVLNEGGLLSLVSHSSNAELDFNHGKGAVGLAIAAESYLAHNPDSLLVSLDSSLAHYWLAEREDGYLPDLIGIGTDRDLPRIDIIEVKTHSGDYSIDGSSISGRAVEQIFALENLIDEIFSANSRITTTSRKEILREQVFDSLLQADIAPDKKKELCDYLNELFAGVLRINKRRLVCLVDGDAEETTTCEYTCPMHQGEGLSLVTVGSKDIQAVLSGGAPGAFSSNTVGLSQSGGGRDGNSSTEAPESIPLNEKYIVESPPAPDVMAECQQQVAQPAAPQDEIQGIEEKNNTLSKRVNYVLRSYGINAQPVKPEEIQHAARFTRVIIRLSTGESINKLERYKRDIGRELEALGDILISANRGSSSISLDIPYDNLDGKPLLLTNYLDQLPAHAENSLPFLAGQSADGAIETIDLALAPHMLIAGTTGSGKTVFLYSILVSLIKLYSSKELEIIIIDPKQTDFVFFDGVHHLRDEHVIIDAAEAISALQRIIESDIPERTQLLRACRSRDISSYNVKNPTSHMKRLVVIIDEYADLIQEASAQGMRKDFEERLRRLAQRVRNLGIHLVLATQRPSSNIVTGDLKAVLPFRISFKLLQHQDSMTILDCPGAEDLLGRGDMLILNDSGLKRLQGMYITEAELQKFLDEQSNQE